MSSSQLFELNKLDVTHAAGVTFIKTLDEQIQEMVDNTERLKLLRAAAARTFGVDRPESNSFVSKLTAGANRSELESEQKAGAV